MIHFSKLKNDIDNRLTRNSELTNEETEQIIT